MRPCVFLGPTLAREDVTRHLPQAEVLPPVRAGDIRAALERGSTAIGIIDGLFEQVATVWHKEILFALSRGVWVYGGASMGALRAAELHTFGVVGIGAIFEAYRSGELEDDDEVAVAHASADESFRQLSDAMVNIRFGLDRARSLDVISQSTRDTLLGAAKARFYTDRSWKALFAGDHTVGVDPRELEELEAWVRREGPNQKRDDALALVSRMASDIERQIGPFRPEFAFEPTVFWDRAERRLREKEE